MMKSGVFLTTMIKSVVDNDEIGGHIRKCRTLSQSLNNNESLSSTPTKCTEVAKMQNELMAERTGKNGECTQTVLRGEALSYRK